MPKYEYDCPRCGSFSEFRPMAECELSAICPNCRADLPRGLLSFPMIRTGTASVPRGGRALTNRFSAASSHSPGCRCCGGRNLKIPREEWISKLL